MAHMFLASAHPALIHLNWWIMAAYGAASIGFFSLGYTGSRSVAISKTSAVVPILAAAFLLFAFLTIQIQGGWSARQPTAYGRLVTAVEQQHRREACLAFGQTTPEKYAACMTAKK